MQKFDTPSPIAAVLDIPAGRVQFIATDRSDTTAQVLPANTTSGRDRKAAELTTVDYSDGVLRIQAPAKNQYFGPTGSVEVTVQLPTGSRVKATATSAEFRTVGRLGSVTFDSSHGTIKLDEAASAHLTTVDGDITVGRLGGDAQIRTSRGDIQIAEARHGMVVLATQAGSISVGAASGVSASLDAGTSHGRISNNLMNDGTAGLNIHATTATGDITARSL